MANNILDYSELANKILNTNTEYHSAKSIIDKVFKLNISDYKETIKLRLTVIDSFYSTNMNKRYYGIDDIASRMIFYYPNDELLVNDLINFIDNSFSNDQLLDIFNSCYGISKTGQEKGAAKSLISKYFYFLTKGKFPIYDTIVFETYPLIIKYFSITGPGSKLTKNISEFINNMAYLNRISGINDFNKLDNLLWLIGKLLRGNLSLIINREIYKSLFADLNENSDNFSLKVKKRLFDESESIKPLIPDELYKIILFVKETNMASQIKLTELS